MLPTSTAILIVGAGPAGLCLALALHKQGCPDVVVVDAALQGQNTSRAVAVHAATVEVCRRSSAVPFSSHEGLCDLILYSCPGS